MKTLRSFALAALVCLALGAPTTASAQGSADYSNHGPEFWDRLEMQLTRSLGSTNATVRTTAAHQIVHFATFYPEQAHFDKAAPRLLDLYQFSRKESHRMLALAALNAIQEDHSMQYLSQIVHRERHPVVRQIAVATLVEYQNEKRATL